MQSVYLSHKASNQAQMQELSEKMERLEKSSQTTTEQGGAFIEKYKEYMNIVRKYTSFEELIPTLLREFIEKIVIHEAEPLDGKRHGKLRKQEIEIYYSFVGKVDLPE